MKALETLLRVAKAEADVRQRALAAIASRQGAVAEAIRARNLAAASEQASGEDGPAFAAFARRMRQEVRRLELEQKRLAKEEAELRAQLAEAFLEQKKLESLVAQAAARESAAAARIEMRAMDEVAGRTGAR